MANQGVNLMGSSGKRRKLFAVGDHCGETMESRASIDVQTNGLSEAAGKNLKWAGAATAIEATTKALLEPVRLTTLEYYLAIGAGMEGGIEPSMDDLAEGRSEVQAGIYAAALAARETIRVGRSQPQLGKESVPKARNDARPEFDEEVVLGSGHEIAIAKAPGAIEKASAVTTTWTGNEIEKKISSEDRTREHVGADAMQVGTANGSACIILGEDKEEFGRVERSAGFSERVGNLLAQLEKAEASCFAARTKAKMAQEPVPIPRNDAEPGLDEEVASVAVIGTMSASATDIATENAPGAGTKTAAGTTRGTANEIGRRVSREGTTREDTGAEANAMQVSTANGSACIILGEDEEEFERVERSAEFSERVRNFLAELEEAEASYFAARTKVKMAQEAVPRPRNDAEPGVDEEVGSVAVIGIVSASATDIATEKASGAGTKSTAGTTTGTGNAIGRRVSREDRTREHIGAEADAMQVGTSNASAHRIPRENEEEFERKCGAERQEQLLNLLAESEKAEARYSGTGAEGKGRRDEPDEPEEPFKDPPGYFERVLIATAGARSITSALEQYLANSFAAFERERRQIEKDLGDKEALWERERSRIKRDLEDKQAAWEREEQTLKEELQEHKHLEKSYRRQLREGFSD